MSSNDHSEQASPPTRAEERHRDNRLRLVLGLAALATAIDAILGFGSGEPAVKAAAPAAAGAALAVIAIMGFSGGPARTGLRNGLATTLVLLALVFLVWAYF